MFVIFGKNKLAIKWPCLTAEKDKKYSLTMKKMVEFGPVSSRCKVNYKFRDMLNM